IRLGGSRVAEIGHRALGLPSVSTLRRYTTIRPLLPSPGMPIVEEIESNIDSCLDATAKSQGTSLRIIATEKRVRYDDRNNKVVRVCRQHGHNIPLDLSPEEDLGVLCNGLKKGDVHLAAEATVAALGALSKNTREYSARPILFSSDYEKESEAEQARNVLRPLVTAMNNKSEHRNTKFRLVSVASDGESRRGTAFAKEYMKKPLPHESLIYLLLSGLEFMNFLTGDDEVTCDKDFKHAIKCLRGLTMRDSGIEILGFLITVPIFRQHLLANGLTTKQINSYLNPNDKQDV
ncbi:hypothetical protein B0H13DRAFT_1533428, partial [Mycena leptocephala]